MLRSLKFKERGRRRWLLLVTLVLSVGALGGFLVSNALAVHDLAFQLDGDVSSTCPPNSALTFCNSTTQRDWADIFTVSNNATANTQAVSTNTSVVNSSSAFNAASFQRDFQTGPNCALNSLSTTFCTGDDTTFATGSKDTLDITGWQCNHDNNVNSKIDIMNAYSVAYTDPTSGDKILYFGMEKNKDNGTNDVGFWFLQGGANCSAPTGHQSWSGQHQVGDVLVVSEFTLGGGVSTITAYEWVGGTNPLKQLTSSVTDCKSAGASDTICATTNSGAKPFNGNITTPWLTSDATLGVGHTVVPPDFFEGGIDLTKAFAGSTVPQCFNTFIGDTRSSTALTATLFDYTRGQLGECNTTLSTQENASSPVSIGTGTVSSGTDTAKLNVSGTTTWGGTLKWYLCGPVSSDGCNVNDGVLVTSRTVSNSSPASDFISGTATLTSAGRYCWHTRFDPDTASAGAGVKAADDDGSNECFTVTPVTPTLTTLASCTSSPCVLGVDTLSDTATLTGAASQPGTNGPGGATGLYKSINATNGAAPDSAISWTLYGPTNGGCTDAKALSPSTATVSGNNTYGPVTYKPVLSDGIGTYTFVATYPGNGPNTNAATPTGCPDTSGTETVTVIGSASSSSAQRWLPNDRVVLTTTGGTLNGTLTVTLYSGTFSGTAANCSAGSATAVSGQQYTFNANGDASGTAYNTSNTSFQVGTNSDGTAAGAAGGYFWLIHYHDNNLTSPPDRCETSNVSITDG